MADSNPYTTPDAVLSSMEEVETYEPAIVSFSGRIGRMRYLAYTTAMYVALAAIGLIGSLIVGVEAFVTGDPAAMPISAWVLFGVIYLFAFIISLMYGKRRLNDLNRTGWWQLLYFIPPILSFFMPLIGLLGLLAIPLAIYMLFFPGTSGNNDYGPEPTDNTMGVLILAWIWIALVLLSIIGVIAAIVIPLFAA